MLVLDFPSPEWWKAELTEMIGYTEMVSLSVDS